ncbi:MAG: 3-deoxy-D-manno-octulosonic acid transferase, partial [Deltaproteobacteria bacterium]
PWDAADYLPLDLPWKVSKALDSITPRALILINRELWPELLVQAQRRNIPVFLFSAFFPPHKTKMLKVWPPYLKLLKCVGTVGESSTQWVLRALQEHKPLGTKPDFQAPPQGTEASPQVFSIGDTRVERVLERRSLQLTPPAWSDFLNQRPLMVGASLWKEDFEALKLALAETGIQNSGWRFCLVPHEPQEDFISSIKNWGKNKGILFRRFSHFLETPDDFSPLIMDRVGLLAELYRFSSLAFVGGSFKSRVHNVLEPAAYKNAIITGPFIQNSFEATEMARLKSGLLSVDSSQKARDAILNRMSNVSLLKSEGEAAFNYLMEHQGASRKYCDLLLD